MATAQGRCDPGPPATSRSTLDAGIGRWDADVRGASEEASTDELSHVARSQDYRGALGLLEWSEILALPCAGRTA